MGPRLEFDRFAMPAPDWQVLLAVPTELAAERARRREPRRRPTAPATPTSATTVCSVAPATVYAALAAAQWGGRWVVAGPDVVAGDLTRTLTG